MMYRQHRLVLGLLIDLCCYRINHALSFRHGISWTTSSYVHQKQTLSTKCQQDEESSFTTPSTTASRIPTPAPYPYPPTITTTISDDVVSISSSSNISISIGLKNNTTKTGAFQQMRRQMPLKLQYWLRDSGILRTITDTLTLLTMVPDLLQQHHPHALSEYVHMSGAKTWQKHFVSKLLLSSSQNSVHQHHHLSNNSTQQQNSKILAIPLTLEKIAYGLKTPSQCVQLLYPKTTTTTTTVITATSSIDQLVVFVHGGAWGSGFPALYRFIAKPFLLENMAVAIVGYRTYPTTDCAGQIQDVLDAVQSVSHRFRDITLIGHSSGAHLCVMALLQAMSSSSKMSLHVNRWIGIAGVYHIPSHYLYERERGVERISPMSQACGGPNLSQWRQYSPTVLLSKEQRPHLPEQRVNAASILPRTLLVHGNLDETVPYSSSTNFAKAIHSTGCSCDLRIIEMMGHADPILDLMFDGSTQHTILQWMKET